MRSRTKAIGAFLCVACLSGCVAALASIILTEVAPRAINGKGLPEDAADLVTGKDCRVIEAALRKDREICETRGSPEARKDFKGLSGLSEDQPPRETP